MLGGAGNQRSTAISNKSMAIVATVCIDISKNSFHVANGGLPPDSCRPGRMPMTAALGQLRTSPD
jgi:hypothetical protein